MLDAWVVSGISSAVLLEALPNMLFDAHFGISAARLARTCLLVQSLVAVALLLLSRMLSWEVSNPAGSHKCAADACGPECLVKSNSRQCQLC